MSNRFTRFITSCAITSTTPPNTPVYLNSTTIECQEEVAEEVDQEAAEAEVAAEAEEEEPARTVVVEEVVVVGAAVAVDLEEEPAVVAGAP